MQGSCREARETDHSPGTVHADNCIRIIVPVWVQRGSDQLPGTGRKGTLLFNNIFSIVPAVMMGASEVAKSYEIIIVARFIVGICAGLSSNVVPMYLGELSPKNLRGALGIVPQLFITIGILSAQVLGIRNILGNNEGWPLMLGLTGIPALIELLLLPFFPESPRYMLIQKGDEKKAKKALQRLRGWDDVDAEMTEMRLEDQSERAEGRLTVFSLLSQRSLRWQLISVVVMNMGQQLSGVNAAAQEKLSTVQCGASGHHMLLLQHLIDLLLRRQHLLLCRSKRERCSVCHSGNRSSECGHDCSSCLHRREVRQTAPPPLGFWDLLCSVCSSDHGPQPPGKCVVDAVRQHRVCHRLRHGPRHRTQSNPQRGDHRDVQAVRQVCSIHGVRLCSLAVQLHRRPRLPLHGERPGPLQLHRFRRHLSAHPGLRLGGGARDQEKNLPGGFPDVRKEEQNRDQAG
ncbi:solute carrier family 2, facilitated glucose transporter member 7 isoform X3 [Oryzias melastigma]|uniref:solute carrier family 2, facilitated glucose transporter member 7 isoform X3 n=1 Tax=Oryzias melastigma TaxID=30732 RepID=UPI00168D4EAE|nr:solute carrier family 2, facilitated glucose transporter member 7 isoform X3 [Oryzias melastigma]